MKLSDKAAEELYRSSDVIASGSSLQTVARLQKIIARVTNCDTLAEELRQIDERLARRPALADCNTRVEKVERACSVAGRETDKANKLVGEKTELVEALQTAMLHIPSLQMRMALNQVLAKHKPSTEAKP